MKSPTIRRSVRLLNAIQELHRQGYQNLACYFYMSSSGFHWRLKLVHYDDLYVDESGRVQCLSLYENHETNHSSGQDGNEYFGWRDAKNASARELAELIKSRFPRLVESTASLNYGYAGWFVYMLGKAAEEALPIFFLEYNETIKGKIYSTKSCVYLEAPPHQPLKVEDNI